MAVFPVSSFRDPAGQFILLSDCAIRIVYPEAAASVSTLLSSPNILKLIQLALLLRLNFAAREKPNPFSGRVFIYNKCRKVSRSSGMSGFLLYHILLNGQAKCFMLVQQHNERYFSTQPKRSW